MAVSAPTIGTTVPGSTAGLSVTLDFTAAAVGSLLLAVIGLADSQVSAPTAPAGWTYIQGSEGTSGAASSRLIVGWRVKQSGDTTQQFTWGTSCKYGAAPVWYPGGGNIEGGTYLAHTVNSANYATATLTPTAGDRWAVMVALSRSTTAGRTFTPDAALTERADFVHAGTNPWPSLEVADSNTTVTAAGHTYTAVCSGSESHGGTIILAVIPSAKTAVAGVAAETDTAFAVGRVKARAQTLAAETDTGSSVTRAKVRPATSPAETDTASAAGRAKSRQPTTVVEGDTASTVERVKATATVTPAESDTALAVPAGKVRVVGLAVDGSIALPAARSKDRPAGTASDTTATFTVAGIKTRPVPAAVDSDLAGTIRAAKTNPVTVAADTGTALPLLPFKARQVAVSTEPDSPIPLTGVKAKPVGTASSTDQARPVARKQPPRPVILTATTIASTLTAATTATDLNTTSSGENTLTASTI